MQQQTSIKKRLTLWLTLPMLVVAILISTLIFSFLRTKINEHFDNMLQAASKNIEDRLHVRDGILKFNMPYFGLDIQTASGNGSIFYSVSTKKGELLSGFENIPSPKKFEVNTPVFYYSKYTGQAIRALFMRHQFYRAGRLYHADVIIAETLEDRHAMIQDIFLVTVGATLLIMLIPIVTFIFSINIGLRPLNKLQESIHRRDMNDLTHIKDETVPLEVKSLVQSLNHLFERLKRSFAHVEKFNADVSHQLRTPLAELKMTLEMDEVFQKNPKKKHYLGIIENMVHTTQQLLFYAKTNPDAFDTVRFTSFDLRELCEKVCAEKVPFIYQKGYEFAFEAKGRHFIHGGPIILEGLIQNLLENAANYAVDEEGNPRGVITLRLEEESENVILSVLDEGCGIPEEHLEDIFERFFRLDTRRQGSGLGLSIVKQIVHLHKGKIELQNRTPHGLHVKITLPKVS